MSHESPAYRQLTERWARGEPTVMDGGIGSELKAMGYSPGEAHGPVNFTWGTLALYDAPETVKAMHRRYVDAGADILLTNTFMFHRCVRMERDGDLAVPSGTWREKARLSVRLAREAAREGGRPDAAVVFAMMIQDSPKAEWAVNRANSDRGSKDWKEMVAPEYLRDLARTLESEPPDAFLVELAPPIAEELRFPHFETLLATGFPLWIAYRRAVGGPVGIFGDPLPTDGDLFGRAVRRLEELGVGAVLVHCLPPANAHGVALWLRRFTSLPIGVYPNNGRYDMYTWQWEHTVSPDELADHARRYVAEGFATVGGCCGVQPAHIAAVARAVKPAPTPARGR
jgi:S-methylmethionine-dependent homocysteine/selenocysteine methylase